MYLVIEGSGGIEHREACIAGIGAAGMESGASATAQGDVAPPPNVVACIGFKDCRWVPQAGRDGRRRRTTVSPACRYFGLPAAVAERGAARARALMAAGLDRAWRPQRQPGALTSTIDIHDMVNPSFEPLPDPPTI